MPHPYIRVGVYAEIGQSLYRHTVWVI